MNETTTHLALDEFDAAMRTPRQRLAAIAKENAELTAEANALRRETTRLTGENAEFRTEIQSLNEARRVLTAELEEARKQPVHVLPVMTPELLHEWYRFVGNGMPEHEQWNVILNRHFRETAEARTKPTVDVEAVMRRAKELWRSQPLNAALEQALREYLTDAPAPAADAAAQPTTPEAKAAFAARVRRECAENLRADGAKYGDIPFFWKMTADRMERGE